MYVVHTNTLLLLLYLIFNKAVACKINNHYRKTIIIYYYALLRLGILRLCYCVYGHTFLEHWLYDSCSFRFTVSDSFRFPHERPQKRYPVITAPTLVFICVLNAVVRIFLDYLEHTNIILSTLSCTGAAAVSLVVYPVSTSEIFN